MLDFPVLMVLSDLDDTHRQWWGNIFGRAKEEKSPMRGHFFVASVYRLPNRSAGYKSRMIRFEKRVCGQPLESTNQGRL